MPELNDIENHNEINNAFYAFEGAQVRLHPSAPIFKGITFMTRFDGVWRIFTCKDRLQDNLGNDYAIVAEETAYTFPKCVCKRIVEIQ